MRQSLELSLTDKFKQLLKTIQYSVDPPEQQKAWQELGNDLPFDSIEKFLSFEQSLKEDEEKKKSLVSTKYSKFSYSRVNKALWFEVPRSSYDFDHLFFNIFVFLYYVNQKSFTGGNKYFHRYFAVSN